MKYNEYNFIITKDLKKKIFSIFKIIKINKLFSNKKIQKEFNLNSKTDLENLFIKNCELIINGLVKTYFYYRNLKKKKINKKDLQKKIHKRINNLFGKSKISDIKILIFIYENFIYKIGLVSFLELINNMKNNLKGGSFFSSDPDFPNPKPDTFFEKIKTYVPILYYLENKYPWIEWALLIFDIVMDIAGMIPLYGFVVDIVSVIVAILRKDWIDVLLSLIQLIPAVGIFAGPVGILRKITRGYNKFKQIKNYKNTAKEIMYDNDEDY